MQRICMVCPIHQDVKTEMERLRTEAKLQLCISPIYEVTGSLLKCATLMQGLFISKSKTYIKT